MTDWNLVAESLLALDWLHESDRSENSNKKLIELWKEKFHSRYPEGKKLMNFGVVMMASYLLFVYIKENEYVNFDYSQIDDSKFKIIIKDKKTKNTNQFCKRIRNSIAHGRFKIEGTEIIMEDANPKGNNYIKFSISIIDFAEFIDAFTHEIYRQKVIG